MDYQKFTSLKKLKTAVETQKYENIEIPNNRDLKIRPIVASLPCPINRLSKLIDILLQHFLNEIKIYIKDSIHFLNSIPQKIDPDTRIVTFDVINLYSNIPLELGKQAISFWIEKYPDWKIPRKIAPKFQQKIYYRK